MFEFGFGVEYFEDWYGSYCGVVWVGDDVFWVVVDCVWVDFVYYEGDFGVYVLGVGVVDYDCIGFGEMGGIGVVGGGVG